jgi:hypothetical protein
LGNKEKELAQQREFAAAAFDIRYRDEGSWSFVVFALHNDKALCGDFGQRSPKATIAASRSSL